MRSVLIALVVLFPCIARADFVYDDGGIPNSPKTDYVTTAVPPTEKIVAADWNAVVDALTSERTAILHGEFHGLAPMLAPPATPVDGLVLYTLADGGGVWVLTPDGATHEVSYGTSTSVLPGLSFPPASGSTGVVLYSLTDGGGTWQANADGTQAELVTTASELWNDAGSSSIEPSGSTVILAPNGITTNTVTANTSGTSLTLNGYLMAASGSSGVNIDTNGVLRSAGYLLQVNNDNIGKFLVDFNGNVSATGFLGTGSIVINGSGFGTIQFNDFSLSENTFGDLEINSDVAASGGFKVGTGSSNDIVPVIVGTTSQTAILAQSAILVAGAKTVTFAKSYSSAPSCVCSDSTTVAAVKCATTTTTLTITGTGTDLIQYICIGPVVAIP